MLSDSGNIFTLILLPVQQCNLSCSYCYSDNSSNQAMCRSTLRITLERAAHYIERLGFSKIHILWHGGEPLLAGLDFFRDAAKFAEELFGKHCRHFLQTNGLLLNTDFCRFFREHNFQIGVSIDAFAELHNTMRVFNDGKGSHQQVQDMLSLAEENDLQMGLNAVITHMCLGREKEFYQYFQRIGYGFQVNPVLPVANAARTGCYLLRPGEYGTFLCRLFDEWTNAEVRRVPVSPLDLYLKAILNDTPYECRQRMTCVGSHLGVKPSGDTLLCSLFSNHSLGNVHDVSLETMFAAPLCTKISHRAETLTECHSCTYWSVCHGGCPYNGLSFSQNYMAKDYFCRDYKLIFGKLRRAIREDKEESMRDKP